MKKNLRWVLSALIILALAGVASADIFYAASNYNAGSVGVIRGNSRSGYEINPKLVSNYNGDTAGFAFHDHEGNLRALVRERSSGIGDSVWVYGPPNFSTPIFNRKGYGSNIHAIASDGDDLYLVTYESYPVGPEDTGEVIRVNMRNGYTVTNRYHNKKFLYAGFLPAAGSVNWAWPHGEGVMVHNDKVYVMFGMSDPSKNIDYAPTEIVEFNRDLTPTGDKAVLKEGIQIGKNSLTMAMYNGKLYVGCIGGRQGTGVFGDVWEVDLGSPNTAGDMTAKQALDFENVTGVLAGAGWGAYGVDFTDDGTAFILAGGYNSAMDFKGRLFKIPAADLAAGGATAINALVTAHDFTNASGHSWWDGVTWDAKSQTVWIMAGTHLFAFDKDGNVKRDFTPAELGEDIYSVALFNEKIPDGPGITAADPPPAAVGDIPPGIVPVSSSDVRIVKAEGETVEKVLDGLGISTDKAPLFRINKNNDQLEIDPAVLQNLLGEHLSQEEFTNVDFDKTMPVGVFETQNNAVQANETALVTYKANFGLLAGYNFDSFMLMKLKTDGKIEELRRAESWAEMSAAKYIITDESGEPQSGTVEDKEYSVSIAIENGSLYDWSPAAQTVIDPSSFVPIGGTDYTQDTGEDSGGMPGGCAAGAGGFAALAALAMILYRKKRG